MKKGLYIYGAGGLGREIASMIGSLPEWEVEGFIDDFTKAGTIINGVIVKGDENFLLKSDKAISVVLAFGDPRVKANIVQKLRTNKLIEFPILVHPSAIIQDKQTVILGQGSVICAGCVLTTDIKVGELVLINLNTTIGHDVVIGNCASLMTGINVAGGVAIGDNVLIGSGVNIRNKVTIGDGAIVGMGSVVLEDVQPHVTVVGVPAKVKRS